MDDREQEAFDAMRTALSRIVHNPEARIGGDIRAGAVGALRVADKIVNETYRRFRWECSKCWIPGRIAGQAFTGYVCQTCGEEKQHPNTDIPNHCPMCCKDKKICARCGGPMD